MDGCHWFLSCIYHQGFFAGCAVSMLVCLVDAGLLARSFPRPRRIVASWTAYMSAFYVLAAAPAALAIGGMRTSI